MSDSASRPLVICDCDEVVLRMVAHFKDWLAENHDVEFNLQGNDFAAAMRRRETGELLDKREIWALLGGFFDSEMHRAQWRVSTLWPSAPMW